MVYPQQVGMGILDAFRMGQQEREKREYRGALGDYAVNPTGVNLARLAPYDPELVLSERGRMAKEEKAQQIAQIGQQAMKGDVDALEQLFTLDNDLWNRLDDRQRGELKRTNDYMGQAAMQIGRLPEEQRGAAWSEAVKQAEQGGMDIPDYLEGYSPQTLDTAVRMAGVVEKYVKQFEPDYRAVGFDQDLVDVNNPQALAQFAANRSGGATAGDIPTVNSPEEAKALGPGAQFRTPDGRIMRVPGGAASNGAAPFGP